MRIFCIAIVLLCSACTGRGYHSYAVTNSMRSSDQFKHIQALQTQETSNLLRTAKVCLYYPRELGGFSDGCGEIEFNPYENQLSLR